MKLGEKQTLFVVKKVEFGVYLAESHNDSENRVLLPSKQVPPGTGIGDQLEVFLYKDSKDRLIATTNTPKLMMGEGGTNSSPDRQDRSFSGLGAGKGSAPALSPAGQTSTRGGKGIGIPLHR